MTNATYLRRLYLRLQDVELLFPERLVFIHSHKNKNKHARWTFWCVDSVGVRWPVSCEHAARHGKVRCRLVDGWAALCRDKGVAVGDCVVLRPNKEPRCVSVVVERVASGAEAVDACL